MMESLTKGGGMQYSEIHYLEELHDLVD